MDLVVSREWDLIASRVKIGLENARAKGRQIGRKKLRDSHLIRSLLKNGMSFRQISLIAKCSHGSVSAEKKAMLKDELELTKKLALQAEAEKKLQETGSIFPDVHGESAKM